MHDDALQRLLAVAARLGLADARAPADLRPLLADAGRELHDALHELRELARELHPALLTSDGLAAAVRAAAERLPLSGDLVIPSRRFPPCAEGVAYGVLAAALRDAADRGARHVRIAVRDDGRRLCFRVHDDAARLGGAVGAAGEQVRALGGRVRASGRPDTGTVVSGWVPI